MIRVSNYTENEFRDQVKGKKVICFCAGQKFREMCVKYQLAADILYVVDNYVNDKSINVDGRDISILRMKEMGDEARECMLLLTSMKNAEDLISQLDKSTLCNNQIFYIPELFGSEPDSFEIACGLPERIPRCIHYCWFGGGKMPEAYCRNIETWKQHCPDYEIIRWDENNYDVFKNKYMRQAYKAKKWGFVPDYARADIINSYGGIYLDTDVELLRPLDSLLQYDMFCGFESSRHVNFGLGFGAVRNHPIMEAVLAEYERCEFGEENDRGELVASPVYQTRVLERFGLARNGKTQILEHFIALSPEYLCPLNQYGVGMPSRNSFSIHQYAATWFEDGKRKAKEVLSENYHFVFRRMMEEGIEACQKLPWGYL